MTDDRSFDEWVCRRLHGWPTAQILDLERWLREQERVEFLPAVHETLRRRGMPIVIATARPVTPAA